MSTKIYASEDYVRWENLPDKPFGETTEMVEIVPETNMEEEASDWLIDGITLEVGKTYFVYINGVEYESVAFHIDEDGVIGTAVLVEDGEISYLIVDLDEPLEGYPYMVYFQFINAPAITSFSIHTLYEDIQLIDEKYLPDTVATKNELTEINTTLAEKITAPSTATVGQTIVVKTVDENGKPTEWETVDMPEQIQSDWNIADETDVGYIKNKPFETIAWVPCVISGVEIISGTVVNNNDTIQFLDASNSLFACSAADQPVIVVINDTEYPVDVWEHTLDGDFYNYDDGNIKFTVMAYSVAGGVIFYDEAYVGAEVSIKYPDTANKMSEQFLPESVAGVVIRSSTEGSTKKFKLTVDDSGTITATEV